MTKKRSQNGAMLPVVLACAAILVIIIVGAFSLSFIFSGEQKVRSVVDSGALMLAHNAPNLKVKPVPGFEDCADTSGKIGLMNINRVIGKAMLINMNAEDMKNSGQTGTSDAAATAAQGLSDSIASQVKDKVTDTQASTVAFQVAVPKRSGGGSADVASSDGGGGAAPQFDSSFVHRNDESNVAIDKGQLPESIKLPEDAVVEQGKSTEMMRGYRPIKVNGRDFYFIPFRTKELPHLISTEEFSSNKKDAKPLDWGNAIPNAYKVTANGGVSPNMVSIAAAVANPQQRYNITIPHGYIGIKLHQTQVTWKVNGKAAGANTEYYFQPQQQNGVKKFDVQCAKVDGFASLGNEYKAQDLLSIINAVPSADNHKKMFQTMEQRLKEIDPGFGDVKNLLQTQQVDQNDLEFLLYPEYKEKDNTDPKIRIGTKSGASSSWLNKSAPPDGEQKQIGQEQLEDGPNSSWVVPMGTWKLNKATVKVSGKILWTPGTGANQNLGVMEIFRTCDVTFEGKCP
jgi:hypothetical protein